MNCLLNNSGLIVVSLSIAVLILVISSFEKSSLVYNKLSNSVLSVNIMLLIGVLTLVLLVVVYFFLISLIISILKIHKTYALMNDVYV